VGVDTKAGSGKGGGKGGGMQRKLSSSYEMGQPIKPMLAKAQNNLVDPFGATFKTSKADGPWQVHIRIPAVNS